MRKGLLFVLVLLTFGVTGVYAQPADTGPGEVVEEFYTWYLASIGAGETLRNPLVERAYQDSDLLTGEFVARVDAALAGMVDGGFDPFLSAQDVPARVQVGAPAMAEDAQSALVPVYTSFPGHVLAVSVVQVDGAWRIDDVQRAELATPEDVTSSFYTHHLSYGSPADEGFINPMVAKTYRTNPLLTEPYIAEVDALLESWEKEYGGYVADPFLCAQDIPTSFAVEAARYGDDEQTADVVVRTSFMDHAVTVDLIRRGDQWLINGIRCGETRTPAGAVRRFYDWYLAYNRWDGDGERPNALVDGAYRDSDLLTGEFMAQVDEALAGMVDGGFDPFLCAQDVPGVIRVVDVTEMTENEARVTVESSFEGHTFDVLLVQDEGGWQIDDIACQ